MKYDRAIVSPVGKTGAAPSVDLKVGDFMPVKLTGADGLIGARAGQTVGHYIKLISLAPNLSNFKLYDTSLARAIATCGAVCNGLPAGGAGEDRLEKYIADNLLPWAAADFAPRRPASSTRTRTSSRAATSSGPTASRSSTTSSGRSSRTPTSRWSATRSPTRSRTSSWALVRQDRRRRRR